MNGSKESSPPPDGASVPMSNSSSQQDLAMEETPSSSLDISAVTIEDVFVKNHDHADDVLDLSSQNMEKLGRAAPDFVLNTTTLLLDNNCLLRLDNIHTYQCLEKVLLQ